MKIKIDEKISPAEQRIYRSLTYTQNNILSIVCLFLGIASLFGLAKWKESPLWIKIPPDICILIAAAGLLFSSRWQWIHFKKLSLKSFSPYKLLLVGVMLVVFGFLLTFMRPPAP